jgi:hypothetical protein
MGTFALICLQAMAYAIMRRRFPVQRFDGLDMVWECWIRFVDSRSFRSVQFRSDPGLTDAVIVLDS